MAEESITSALTPQNKYDVLVSLMDLELNSDSIKLHGNIITHLSPYIHELNRLKTTITMMELRPRDYDETEILDYSIVYCDKDGNKHNKDIYDVMNTSKYDTNKYYNLELKFAYNEHELPENYDRDLIWTDEDGKILTNNIELDYYMRDNVDTKDYKYGCVLLLTGKVKRDIKDMPKYKETLLAYNRLKEKIKVEIAKVII